MPKIIPPLDRVVLPGGNLNFWVSIFAGGWLHWRMQQLFCLLRDTGGIPTISEQTEELLRTSRKRSNVKTKISGHIP